MGPNTNIAVIILPQPFLLYLEHSMPESTTCWKCGGALQELLLPLPRAAARVPDVPVF